VIYIYLAETGGVVFLPEGADVVDIEGSPEIRVVDLMGRVLAVFQRKDASLYSTKPLPSGDSVGSAK
jgi:hypothetical protein